MFQKPNSDLKNGYHLCILKLITRIWLSWMDLVSIGMERNQTYFLWFDIGFNGTLKAPANPQDGHQPTLSVPGAPEIATPSTEDNRILVQNLGAQPCDDQLCHQHGKCVSQNGEAVCECLAGYSGEFCQDGIFASLRTPLLYGAIALVGIIIVIGILFALKRTSSQRCCSFSICTYWPHLQHTAANGLQVLEHLISNLRFTTQVLRAMNSS